MTQRYTTHFRLPIPQFNVTPWHGAFEASLHQIDSLMYRMGLADNVNLWENSTAYLIGDLAIDGVDGSLWQCRVSHTSAATPTTFATARAANPTYWGVFATSINPRGEWTNSTAYAFYDLIYVSDLAVIALCATAHTSNPSGDFGDDIANWSIIADFSTSVIADDIIYDNLDSGLTATNIQDAIDEVVERIEIVEADIEDGDIIIRRPSETITAATATLTEDDQNRWIYVDTTTNSPAITLPALSGGDAGWECTFVKTNTGTNPLFILPPSGTLLSGSQSLAKTRRCVPGVPFKATWSGTKWIIDRCIGLPIGATIPFELATVPVGYELAYGQTLTSASANYPDYYAANGSSGVVVDKRGRVTAGKDDMGGSSANRLTGLSGGINGDTLGTTGGGETHTLVTGNIPQFTPAGTIVTTVTSLSGRIRDNNTGTGGSVKLLSIAADQSGVQVSTDWLAASVLASTFTGTPFGSASPTAANLVQPTIISNMLIVVE